MYVSTALLFVDTIMWHHFWIGMLWTIQLSKASGEDLSPSGLNTPKVIDKSFVVDAKASSGDTPVALSEPVLGSIVSLLNIVFVSPYLYSQLFMYIHIENEKSTDDELPGNFVAGIVTAFFALPPLFKFFVVLSRKTFA